MAAVGGEPYSGVVGRTRVRATHVSCGCGCIFTAELHAGVDAGRDAALAARLQAGELHQVTCPSCGATSTVEVPVVYHDPGRRVLCLVLPVGTRHRELAERAALLGEMAADPAHAVPAYARDFTVVLGAAGLRDHLGRAEGARAAEAQRNGELAQRERELLQRERDLLQRERDVARREQELHAHVADLEQHQQEVAADVAALAEQRKSIDRRVAELDLRDSDLGQRAAELENRAAELDGRAVALQAEAAAAAMGGTPAAAMSDDRTGRTHIPRREEMLQTGPFSRLDDVELPAPPPRRRADSNATRVAPPLRDVAVERWILSRAPLHKLMDGGRVRLLATLSPQRLDGLLASPLEARIQLHRLPTYPVLTISIARKGDDAGDALSFPFDLQRLDDRAVLGALAQGFRFVLDLYDAEYLPVVQREVEAPLEANVRHVLAQAEAHLAAIPPSQRSYDAALSSFHQSPADHWGRRPANLDEDSFSLLPTPGTARLALGIVVYWTEPENEDYLLLVRSFPLDWWKRIRGRVLARSVDFGLALPDGLAELAVAEGLARSRRDLLLRQAAAFADVQTGLKPNDLEPEQARDNWRQLLIQAESLGVKLDGRAADLAAIATGHAPVPVDTGGRIRSGWTAPDASRDLVRAGGVVIAGEIRPRAGGLQRRDLRAQKSEDLLHLLDDKDLRRDAAIELCRRAEPAAVGPVFGAIRRMTRGEAVRVLPAVNHFGERAVPHLIDGLRSRKAYLRQGCALALGVLKSAEGIDPLCDLLIGEPTDVWREVARAIGEVGPGAVMSLAARLRESRGEPAAPDRRERIAWALAHVAARGASGPVETLAGGRDPSAAQAAKRALELAATAKLNDAEVRGNGANSREHTVNRAFSRRFFEAMQGRTGPTPLLTEEGEEGMALDDSDLLDADEELLDDEDLIPG